MKHIRNFCIIAHIDHGKSTLADKVLLHTKAVNLREFKDQILDDMDLERERGITIKSSCVSFDYTAHDGVTYLLNLIDTPGHVDFTYEVTRALAACEGAVLVVDAAQGVEAQTDANMNLAKKEGLTVIPVINKIDLPHARIDEVTAQLVDIFGFKEDEVLCASAKESLGIEEILDAVVRRVPAPRGSRDENLQALVFDSNYDEYKGVIVYVRVKNGVIAKGVSVKFMQADVSYEVLEMGVFRPHPEVVEQLEQGQVGYIVCNIRNPGQVRIGDTVTMLAKPARNPLPGYRVLKPLVFCGMYPVNPGEYNVLKEAFDKLHLNDPSFTYETENSVSFGLGFRCGFMGFLHMEIVQERLEREFDLSLFITTPNVKYRVITKDGKIYEIDNPLKLPVQEKIREFHEPFIEAFVIVPSETIGVIMQIAQEKRGVYKSTEYLGSASAMLVYEFPLSEILVDFYDKIKSATRGYGSFDYEFKGYRREDLVKLDILINGQVCDALTFIVAKEKAYYKGRELTRKLREIIPRQLFEVAIQAAIGGKIIARESVAPLKKHVTGKCYGGDITRKRKLWEKQKEGKKRMKKFGRVDLPQEAFMAVLKL